ncbi:type VI secretion system baseplate subunit TssK [Massilia sp. Dwa41.01b]|uniref:type VI secretion system baseplate subunit TssK n=1 Tax=Massilia sp. Dwa41.01b TaxID=2709302 RepID=UPI0016017715|nr:type VI secretion system baseplate subunit TssK [Massilia sp. Dwa41.01b]QNA89241.1 type VI secretion system baseplate subunit TssK [Massilia sp. Dwa41.01b]
MNPPTEMSSGLAGLPDAVRWYEGMALLPHHFQQATARAEMLAAALLRARDPLHWGLLRLALEQDGTEVTVTALEAVMPDGLPVVAGPGQRLSIDLARHQPDAEGIWRISLAVAAQTLERRPEPPRYLEHGSVRVADQNPGGADEVISVLRPNLLLVCGHGQGYADAELLPLAQYRRASGVPVDTGYIGPWLRIGTELVLHGRIHALGRKLRSAYAQMADDPVDASRPVARRALLPVLGALVLELDSMCQPGTSHPQVLYGVLARLLGALAAGTGAAVLPTLPRFDYRDLAAGFTPCSTRSTGCMRSWRPTSTGRPSAAWASRSSRSPPPCWAAPRRMWWRS